MSSHARLIILMLAFLLAAGALWWWVSGTEPKDTQVGVGTEPRQTTVVTPPATLNFEPSPAPPTAVDDGVASSVVAVPDAANDPPAQPSGGAISGIVVDHHNNPVADSRVVAVLEHTSHEPMSTTSDSDGEFMLTNLANGDYRLEALRPKLSTIIGRADYTFVRVTGGEEINGVRLVLDLSGETIAGRITNTRGLAVADARVSGFGTKTGSAGAISGIDGGYEILGIKDDSLGLQIYHDAYTNARVTVRAGDIRADIVLEGKGAIAGRVLDAQSRLPIQNFEAHAYSGGWSPRKEELLRLFTSADGRFRIDDIPAEETSIAAQAEGYARKIVPVGKVREHETIEDVVILLDRAAIVDGTVVDAAGNPVPAARVHMDELPLDRESDAAATTDSNGRFTIDTLPPGPNVLVAWHPAHAPGYVRFNVASEQRTEVEIALQTGGTIHGAVTRRGEPANATLYVIASHGEFSASSGSDGRFQVSGIPPGETAITAVINADRTQQHEWISVRPGEFVEVNFDFQAGEGVVVGLLRLDGAPFNAWVQGQPVSSHEQSFGTSGDGEYRLEGLIPGLTNIRIIAYTQDGTSITGTRTVEVLDGAISQADFILEGGPEVSGAVHGVPEGYRLSVEVFDTLAPEPTTAEEHVQLIECCLRGSAFGEEFLLRGLESGEFTVLVSARPENASRFDNWSQHPRAWARLTVPEDGRTHFEAQLQ